MAEQAKVPVIRFAGFTDPWEQRKLIMVAPLQRGFDLPAEKIIPGVYPVMMSNGIGAYHNEYKVKGPGVVTGRSGTIGNLQYVESAFWPHNTTLWVTKFYGNHPKFIYYLYEKIDLKRYKAGSGVPTLNRNDVHDTMVFFPASRKEQELISAVLTYLDNLITLHQRKYGKLVVFKKSMLEKMFPKDGESVPEIRFAGFTDPWEQRKLGELYEKNDERNTFGLGAERTLSIATMTFNSEGNGADASSLPNYKVIRVGDVAFEGHSNKSFAYGRFVVNAVADGIMSPRFSCLRPKNSYPVRFWKYYIHSEQVMREILVRATKSGTMMNELVIDDLFKQSIAVPQEAEQQAIGYFFSHLDTLITLHQRKLELLQNIKKSLLDKMFV